MSNESNATTTGQAPATPATQSGQEPTATNPTQQTPTQTQASEDWKPPTREEWDAYQQEKRKDAAELKEARADAAKYRQERKAREDAELTDLQRAAKERDEHKATADRLRESLAKRDLRDAARTLGVADESALKLVMRLTDPAQVEFDDEGSATNAAALVAALLKEYPALAMQGATPGQQPQQQKPATPPTLGAGANPARGATAASGAGGLSWGYIDNLRPHEYANMAPQRRREITDWIARNPRTTANPAS